MDISTFKTLASKLPPKRSLLLEGDHGIGKSQGIYQLAETLGLPVVERRLSQMTEGDILGLPTLKNNRTEFIPPDWIKMACEKPVMLFLDELNRSTPEIMQAAFQIILDREISGNKLHPETRVAAAINTSHKYQVNEMDPALRDRFWIAQIDPSVEKWIEWAKEAKIIPSVVAFIQREQRHLEHKDKNYDASVIYPSRRAWEFVSDDLKHAKMVDEYEQTGFYQIVMGNVGVEASSSYVEFLKNYAKQISAEDILNKWKTTEKFIEKNKDYFTNEKYCAIIERLEDHAKQKEWTQKQAQNVAEFSRIIPDELTLSFFNKLSTDEKSQTNLIKWYNLVKDEIVSMLEKIAEEQEKENQEKK